MRATRRSGARPADYKAPRGASLEGFLFPATYELKKGPGRMRSRRAARRVQAQLRQGRPALREAQEPDPYDVLIIASLIEREAAVAKERPLIASVIYNRLHDDIGLGIDATVRFITGNWTSRSSSPSSPTRAPTTRACTWASRPARSATPGSPRSRRRAPGADRIPLLRGAVCGNGQAQVRRDGRRVPALRRRVQRAREERGGKSPDRVERARGRPRLPGRPQPLARDDERGLRRARARLALPAAAGAARAFAEPVRALPGSGYRGANVTIPHKLAAHALADELSEAAAAIGAVNTLTLRGRPHPRRQHGRRRPARRAGEPAPATALVLGAAAAARGGLGAARGGRRGHRLEPHAGAGARAGGRARRAPREAGRRGAARERDLGRARAGRLARRAAARGRRRVVVDLVYGDEPTPLVRWAERARRPRRRRARGARAPGRPQPRALDRPRGARRGSCGRPLSSPVSSTSASPKPPPGAADMPGNGDLPAPSSSPLSESRSSGATVFAVQNARNSGGLDAARRVPPSRASPAPPTRRRSAPADPRATLEAPSRERPEERQVRRRALLQLSAGRRSVKAVQGLRGAAAPKDMPKADVQA